VPQYPLHERVWEVYRAPTKAAFHSRMEALSQSAASQDLPPTVRKALEKLCDRTTQYARAYDYPECPRTSNMVDRLMNRMYRVLYAHRGMHASGVERTQAARLGVDVELPTVRPTCRKTKGLYEPGPSTQRETISPLLASEPISLSLVRWPTMPHIENDRVRKFSPHP